jgi:hypothetical protein
VRIGALPTAALGILPTVIGQFHKQQKAWPAELRASSTFTA